MISDETYAINYLRFWWDATPFAPTPSAHFVAFPDAISYYRGKSPSFLAEFGRTVKGVNQAKVRTALAALAKKRGSAFPAIGEFYDAIQVQVKTLDASDVKDIAVATAKDVGKAAAIGVSSYLLIAGALLLLPVLLSAGRKARA